MAVFAVGPSPAIYKSPTGILAVYTVDPSPSIYKQMDGHLNSIYKSNRSESPTSTPWRSVHS
ncbi:hypothetical protein DVK07_03920 [Halorubrum sp. Atlit-26R]|nr:hypothetical protein DVK07_03920 [Halorubrum sp. Atlit-26R]